MSSDILLHPHTYGVVAAYRQNLPQALLITGEVGVGLTTLAHHLADDSPIVSLVEPNNKDVISIDDIRQLYHQLRGKQKGGHIVIIRQADTLTNAAQNAFLKILEEPNIGVRFLLTTYLPQRLLPTIHSRVQHLPVRPITAEQSAHLLDRLEVGDDELRSKILFLANGLPAKLTRLAQDNDYFEAAARVLQDARQFLQGTTYDKLLLVHRYANDRPQALLFLGSLLDILRYTLRRNPRQQTIQYMETLLLAEEKVAAQGHIRTQLLACVFH